MDSNSSLPITSATTTQVFSGSGVLKFLYVDAGTNVVGIIDGTSGTTVNKFTVTSPTVPVSLQLNIAIGAGLRIVTSGTTSVMPVFIRS